MDLIRDVVKDNMVRDVVKDDFTRDVVKDSLIRDVVKDALIRDVVKNDMVRDVVKDDAVRDVVKDDLQFAMGGGIKTPGFGMKGGIKIGDQISEPTPAQGSQVGLVGRACRAAVTRHVGAELRDGRVPACQAQKGQGFSPLTR